MRKFRELIYLYNELYIRYILYVHFILVVLGFISFFYFFISNPYAKFRIFSWYILQGGFVLSLIMLCFLNLNSKFTYYACKFLSIERGLFYILTFIIPLDPIAVILFIEGIPIMDSYYKLISLLLNSDASKYMIILTLIINYVIALILLYGENEYFKTLQKNDYN